MGYAHIACCNFIIYLSNSNLKWFAVICKNNVLVGVVYIYKYLLFYVIDGQRKAVCITDSWAYVNNTHFVRVHRIFKYKLWYSYYIDINVILDYYISIILYNILDK